MSGDEFSAEEEAWIRRELVRDPRLAESTLRGLLEERHRRERQAEEDKLALNWPASLLVVRNR